MRTAQESAMGYTVVPMVRSVVLDTFGEEDETYTDQEAIQAGIQFRVGREIVMGTRTVVVDGDVRLARSTYGTLAIGDRIRVTHAYGEALATAEVYELIAWPTLGPSGIQWPIQRVVL